MSLHLFHPVLNAFQPQGWLQLCFGLGYESKILTSFMKNRWLGRWEWESLFSLLLPPSSLWRKPVNPPLYEGGRCVPEDEGFRLISACSNGCLQGGGWEVTVITCWLSKKREGKRSQVCLLFHWGNLFFPPHCLLDKTLVPSPEVGWGTLLVEAAVGGALGGCCLPGAPLSAGIEGVRFVYAN